MARKNKPVPTPYSTSRTPADPPPDEAQRQAPRNPDDPAGSDIRDPVPTDLRPPGVGTPNLADDDHANDNDTNRRKAPQGGAEPRL